LSVAARLRATQEIDPKKIFVLGHSLGAMLVPRIGQADPAIGGLIAAGGAARPLLEMIIPQLIQKRP
jgi:hypothetical protein